MIIISSVQYKPNFALSPAEVKNNYLRLEPLIAQSFASGSQICVLPELVCTGYCYKSKDEAVLVAERYDGPTFRAMRNMARQGSMYLAYGYVEVDGDNLYNSCNVIDPSGVLVSKYRKINLWGSDFLWATPGSEAPTPVDTEFGQIAPIICRDIKLHTPKNIPRRASSNPFFTSIPDILLACTNWGRGGFPATSWMDLVADKQTTLVVANRYGVENNGGLEVDFGSGGSCVIEPDWTVHTDGLKYGSDCVVSVALPSLKNRRMK